MRELAHSLVEIAGQHGAVTKAFGIQFELPLIHNNLTKQKTGIYYKPQSKGIVEMENWFILDQIDTNTHIISEYRHWEETHCYLLEGEDRCLLIDTGLGICNISKEVKTDGQTGDCRGDTIRERFVKHYKGVDMPHYAFSARKEQKRYAY